MGIIIANLKEIEFFKHNFCHIILYFNFYVYCLSKQTLM